MKCRNPTKPLCQKIAQLGEEQQQLLHDVCALWVWIRPRLQHAFSGTVVAKLDKMFWDGTRVAPVGHGQILGCEFRGFSREHVMPTLKFLAAAKSLKNLEKGVKFGNLFPIGKHRGISEKGVTKSLDLGWVMILVMIPHFGGCYLSLQIQGFYNAFSRKHVKKWGSPCLPQLQGFFQVLRGFNYS